MSEPRAEITYPVGGTRADSLKPPPAPEYEATGEPIEFTWPNCIVTEEPGVDTCDDCNAVAPVLRVTNAGGGDGNYAQWCLGCYAKQRARFKP